MLTERQKNRSDVCCKRQGMHPANALQNTWWLPIAAKNCLLLNLYTFNRKEYKISNSVCRDCATDDHEQEDPKQDRQNPSHELGLSVKLAKSCNNQQWPNEVSSTDAFSDWCRTDIKKATKPYYPELTERGTVSYFKYRCTIVKRDTSTPSWPLQAILLFLIVLAIQQKNAPFCQGFRDSLFADSDYVANINNPVPPTSYLTDAFRNLANSMGLFSIDPLQMMSSTTDNSDGSYMNNPFNGPESFIPGPLRPNSLDEHIKAILIPRVSGTSGNEKVRRYIVNNLKDLKYTVELDEFVDDTPIGKVPFANIIATSNPNACRQLVLACHYDSLMKEGFLGATDSAVPCAMLLHMAETFKDSFRSSSNDKTRDLGLMFIFFDGEEAFKSWTERDSLYGSRHLAAKWEKKQPPSNCRPSMKNELDRMEVMVVLDLIGTSSTSFVKYNRELSHHYENMMRYESDYLKAKGLTGFQMSRETAFKRRYIPLAYIQDDHVPFYKRGVQILSLLASPFPAEWHTIDDNYQIIDFPRTERILHVLERFVFNYKR